MGLTPSSSVVVVCRDPGREDLFDALLADPHDFDMIFVESIARGYARIKELRPGLVVVFTAMNDHESFQLLSMLPHAYAQRIETIEFTTASQKR